MRPHARGLNQGSADPSRVHPSRADSSVPTHCVQCADFGPGELDTRGPRTRRAWASRALTPPSAHTLHTTTLLPLCVEGAFPSLPLPLPLPLPSPPPQALAARNPFGLSPLFPLPNAACMSVLLFLPARDLARASATCYGLHSLVPEVATLAAATLHDRELPAARPWESPARLLQFCEAAGRAAAAARLGQPCVTTGTFHTLVTTGAGQVVVWGESTSGQVRYARPPAPSPRMLTGTLSSHAHPQLAHALTALAPPPPPCLVLAWLSVPQSRFRRSPPPPSPLSARATRARALSRTYHRAFLPTPRC
jgi:hypothetical protein